MRCSRMRHGLLLAIRRVADPACTGAAVDEGRIELRFVRFQLQEQLQHQVAQPWPDRCSGRSILFTKITGVRPWASAFFSTKRV